MTKLITGTMFAIGVLSHKLKIDDAFIGIMASASKILSSFIYVFAVSEWQLYLGKCMHGTRENANSNACGDQRSSGSISLSIC